jgi:hypothetical protein
MVVCMVATAVAASSPRGFFVVARTGPLGTHLFPLPAAHATSRDSPPLPAPYLCLPRHSLLQAQVNWYLSASCRGSGWRRD